MFNPDDHEELTSFLMPITVNPNPSNTDNAPT